jgi:hypothetical protein
VLRDARLPRASICAIVERCTTPTKETVMAESSLLHMQDTPAQTGKGHGTDALGPSDSSDSGSDMRGGPGLNHDDGLGPRSGNTSDPDVDKDAATAGPDIGDADLDSDSDRYGTGERGAVGRDSTEPTDQVLRTDDNERVDGEHVGDDTDVEESVRQRGDEWR